MPNNFRHLGADAFPAGIPRIIEYPSNAEIQNAAAGDLAAIERLAINLAKDYCPVDTGRLQESIRPEGNAGAAAPGVEVLKYTNVHGNRINILGRSGGIANIVDRSGDNIRVRIGTRYGNLGSSKIAGKVIERPGRTVWLRHIGTEVPSNTAYESPSIHSGAVSRDVPAVVGHGRWGIVAGGIVVRGRAVYYARDVHDGLNLHASKGPRPFLRQGMLEAIKSFNVDPRYGTANLPTQVQRSAPLGGAFSETSRFNIGGRTRTYGSVLASQSSYNPLTGGVSYRDPSTGRFTSAESFARTLKSRQAN